MSHSQKTVFVGVSGGVDSSVALSLLLNQGYDVVGVFIRTWQPDWVECTWREERKDAMRVCAQLKVPFLDLDLEKEYKEGVADYMIREYQEGRTPNPDVMCNKEIKFGAFLSWARSRGADFIATGHYVRAEQKNGQTKLLRGIDDNKDQSYFLWTLGQEELQYCLFPIGNYKKENIRSLASSFDLPTAEKKDSQGICFMGEIDMKEFLSHYIPQKNGDVLNDEGEVIGTHRGVLFYTLGERHGFDIAPEHKKTNESPYYVVGKDLKKNTLHVSHNPLALGFSRKIFQLGEVVDNQTLFSVGSHYEGQIRYRSRAIPFKILSYNDNDKKMEIEFEEEIMIAPGQSVVIYRGDECLGGGIVQ